MMAQLPVGYLNMKTDSRVTLQNSVITIENEEDIVTARAAGRVMAADIGLGLADQTRLATAISELTRNVIRYAGEGFCKLDDTSDTENISLKCVVEDHGPGIDNIEQAMTDGFSTGESLGAGLPGTKRLVTTFDIDTRPGETRITIEIRRHRN